MDTKFRIILDSMVFGTLSMNNRNGAQDNLINKILQEKHCVVVNSLFENNYEGYFAHREISERLAREIKKELLVKFDDNDVLVNSRYEEVPLKIKVHSDDHFFFKTAVKISTKGQYIPIMLSEDPTWHKVASDMLKIYKIKILYPSTYLAQ